LVVSERLLHQRPTLRATRARCNRLLAGAMSARAPRLAAFAEVCKQLLLG
jgi:hypothetical protein